MQNKGDGKLVEVVAGQGLPSEEKIDSLQLEVNTMDSVRSVFNNIMCFSIPIC